MVQLARPQHLKCYQLERTNAMPIATLLPLLVQLLGLAAQAAQDAPAIIASIRSIWDVATASSPPTPEQDAEYRTALDEAHRALQAS